MKIFGSKKGLVIIGALLVAAAVLLFVFRGKPGNTLVITKDGEEIVREELKEGRSYRVETDTGYNLFLVTRAENGELGVACMEADCPEQICVHKGRVTMTDDPIVCLPHRVTARIITGR